jgi:hypothetical protein
VSEPQEYNPHCTIGDMFEKLKVYSFLPHKSSHSNGTGRVFVVHYLFPPSPLCARPDHDATRLKRMTHTFSAIER